MDIAIVGSGTIGLTYGWLLSERHGVTHVVRPERSGWYREPFILRVTDRRKAADRRKAIGRREFKGVEAGERQVSAEGEFPYLPRIASDPEEVRCDVVLVTTDRRRLASSLETVRALAGSGHVVFMLNHWDLPSQADGVLKPEQYSLGFPGQVGGGRDGRRIEATVFPWGTVLEAGDDSRARRLREAFEAAGLHVKAQKDMAGWLKLHGLQQSMTVGPILRAGGLDGLLGDREEMKKAVLALREGVSTARADGANPRGSMLGRLTAIPAPLSAALLRRLLGRADVRTMVERHMRHGIEEWMAGYWDVVDAARRHGVPIPHVLEYEPTLAAFARGGSGSFAER